jgi:hypothetical protein
VTPATTFASRSSVQLSVERSSLPLLSGSIRLIETVPARNSLVFLGSAPKGCDDTEARTEEFPPEAARLVSAGIGGHHESCRSGIGLAADSRVNKPIRRPSPRK